MSPQTHGASYDPRGPGRALVRWVAIRDIITRPMLDIYT